MSQNVEAELARARRAVAQSVVLLTRIRVQELRELKLRTGQQILLTEQLLSRRVTGPTS